LYPTKNIIEDDDDKTVITSNITQPKKPAIPPTHAVADTRATLVFALKGTKMKHLQPAVTPLVISLPDGTVVRSTHIYDYEIPSLPTHLEAHIVPDLTVALLIGIRVLCKAGCVVIFTDKACYVMYGGKVILRGYKDPSTDLWILAITPDEVQQQGKLQTSPGSNYVAHATKSTQSQAGLCMAHALQFPMNDEITPKLPEMATFTHSVRTRANAVNFAHQSL
jgi:hypothetical protein